MATASFARGDDSRAVDPDANGWQSALLRQSARAGVVNNIIAFAPNSDATRLEVFTWADAIINPEYRYKEMTVDV